MFEELIRAFLSIFIIMDVIGILPIFSTMSQCVDHKHRLQCAHKSVLVAGGVLFIFLLFGMRLFSYFGITLENFMVAGGILLLLIGIKIVLGINWHEARCSKYGFAAVPIGTPLLAGPGTITTVILLSSTYGYLVTFIAAVLNLLVCWVVLHNSEYLYKFLGHQGSDIVSRIMGLIIAAMAVGFISEGIAGMLGW